jgi:alkaline phosphatase D
MKNESIFLHMARRQPDFVVFIGDFPYTAAGARREIWQKHKVIREDPGFPILTHSVPTYAVWDDHDFGPNDCDGRNPNAAEALLAFKDYWANPTYGSPDNPGIYGSFIVGNVEVFLLDGRYHARQDPAAPTMLGTVQFRWLCDGLRNSRARYKVLASGTPFARIKRDCWGGQFYREEREKLFHFISRNHISGVIGISGDIHRCDIHQLPMGDGMYFYDFTAGALSRVHRRPPKEPWPDALLYSYGYPERNMFGELEFHPAADRKTAITFRSFSGNTGMMHRFRLTPAQLGLEP